VSKPLWSPVDVLAQFGFVVDWESLTEDERQHVTICVQSWYCQRLAAQVGGRVAVKYSVPDCLKPFEVVSAEQAVEARQRGIADREACKPNDCNPYPTGSALASIWDIHFSG
jgi:hypothetical protein